MLSGLRVLVVEGAAAVRRLIRDFLALEGAIVLEAGSAREALDVVRRSNVDIVLTELALQDSSGDVVIAHVRAVSDGRTPVAVMSGAAMSDLSRALDLGAERVFRKPLEWTELVSYLHGRMTGLEANRSEASETEKELRVLIIEDDGAMRALLRDVLEAAGHRVIERADGTDVPDLAERENFDAVVLDKEMPGVNGLDLLSFLRHRLPAVPVIFVTAFGGSAVAEEAARRGAFTYLEKPFRISTVLDTLAAVPRYRVDVQPGSRA